ncbi:MAG: DNA polymerase III subunit beta [Bacteroidetes bacterium]|nr:DNA polymerase III subunit beta [Bacteroidota bacterium]
MNFIVSSSYMFQKLQVLGGIINNSNTLAILDNFLFELDHNKLKVSASDLETTISSTLEVESESKVEFAIPAKILLDTLKTFPEQPLTFKVKDNNTVEISYQGGKSEVASVSAEDFPNAVEVEDAATTKIMAATLATAISNTIFATGNDSLRPVMNGVFFQFLENDARFVGTDAHKLVKYTREDIKSDHQAEFIMPKKPLNLLKNILSGSEDDIVIEYNETNAKFSFEDFELNCRLIDGKYPNYEAVIPTENPNKLIIDRQQFLNTVKRISIFANKTTHQLKLNLSGAQLKISAQDVDYSSSGEERLDCQYNGDDMEIGFNSRFLIEMLSNLTSKDVQLAMSMPNRAGILTPVDGLEDGEKVTMLVMPVMLGN